jgi:hypothetical protein
METNSQFEHAPRNRGLVRAMLGAGAVALVVGGFFAGCASDGKVKAAEASSPAAVVADSTTTVAPAPAPVLEASNTQSQPVRSQSSGNHSTSNQPSGNQPTGGHANAPAPVISSFNTPENIDCHNGNLQNFSASWTTTNAVKTTISIDGAGTYATYGANEAEVTLPFNCSSGHTFLLKAYGQDGQTVSRSITLQPRNVQTPQSGDEDQ